MVILSEDVWKHYISNFGRRFSRNTSICVSQIDVASVLAFDQAPIMRKISTTAFKHSRCSQGAVSVNVCFVNCRGNSSTWNWWYKWKSKKLIGGGKKGKLISKCLSTYTEFTNEWMMGSVMGIAALRETGDFVKEDKMLVSHPLKQMPFLFWRWFLKHLKLSL